MSRGGLTGLGFAAVALVLLCNFHYCCRLLSIQNVSLYDWNIQRAVVALFEFCCISDIQVDDVPFQDADFEAK